MQGIHCGGLIENVGNALIVSAAKITRKVIEVAKKLMVMTRIGVELDDADVEAVTKGHPHRS